MAGPGVGFKIADGYIDIHAEVDHGELQRHVERAVGSISRAARTVSLFADIDRGDVARKLETALHRIPRVARSIEIVADVDRTRITAAIESVIERIPRFARTIELLVDIDALDLARKIEEAIKLIPPPMRTITVNVDVDMGSAIAQLLLMSRLLGGLGNAGGDLGGGLSSSLSGIVNAAGSLLNPFNLVVAAIGAAITVAVGLNAALVLLAPALYVVAGALGAVATIGVGFLGVGAAVALGLRGVTGAIKDMVVEGKVANDVLKKLTPNARGFVLALSPVKRILEDVGRQMQQRLFAGMDAEVRQLIDRFGVLTPFLGMIADGVAGIGRSILSAFSDPRNVERMATIFAAIGRLLDRIGEAFKPVLQAFVKIGEAAIPIVDTLGDGLLNLARRFGDWIDQADRTGAMQSFFREAAAAMKDIVHIGGLVFTILGQLIGIVWPKSLDTSKTIFSGVLDGLQGISDWLDKPENQEKVRRFIDSMVLAFDWLIETGLPKAKEWIDTIENEWIPTIKGWIRTAEGWVHTVQGWVDTVVRWKDTIVGVVNEVATTIMGLPERVGSAFDRVENKLGQVPERLGGAFEGVEDTVRGVFDRVIETAKGVPGRVAEAISRLPETLSTVFGTAVDTVSYHVGYSLGRIVSQFVALPVLVARALVALPGVIATAFSTGWDLAVGFTSNSISTISTFFAELPGRVWGGLVGFWNLVTTTFNTTTTWTLNTAKTLVDGVVTFFTQLPGRAAAAVSGLWNAISGAFFGAKDGATGQAQQTSTSVVDILRSLPGRAASALSGFASAVAGALRTAVGMAVSIGRDIIQGLINGAQSAMGNLIGWARRAAGSFVRGFKDALEMKSPSKVMAREVGRWIPAGIQVGIEGGTPALLRDITGLRDAITGAAALDDLALPSGRLRPAGSATTVTNSTSSSKVENHFNISPGAFTIDASKLSSVSEVIDFVTQLPIAARQLAGAR